jgi:hypothetical protein
MYFDNEIEKQSQLSEQENHYTTCMAYDSRDQWKTNSTLERGNFSNSLSFPLIWSDNSSVFSWILNKIIWRKKHVHIRVFFFDRTFTLGWKDLIEQNNHGEMYYGVLQMVLNRYPWILVRRGPALASNHLFLTWSDQRERTYISWYTW